MTLTPTEIERRLPLWRAVADLYLDTDSADFVSNIVAVARQSEFTADDVDQILRWEVRPALYANYLNVAGEWAGWDNDWLEDRIIKSTRGAHWLRTWPFCRLCRSWFMPSPGSDQIQMMMKAALPLA